MMPITRMLTTSAVALSVVATIACSSDTAVAPRSIAPPNPDLAAVAAAACRAVKGTIGSQATPVGAIGIIAGDLEGTITTVLLPDAVGATNSSTTGTVVHLSGRQTVQVTGGTIPELVGKTLVWTIDSRAVVLPPIRRVSNTLTLVEGATGHLVSHGILDMITHMTQFEYEGEICLE